MTVPQQHSMYRLACIILLVAAVYGSTIRHDFVWDDTYIIVNNPLLEKLSTIPRLFLSEDTIEESTGYYRPVTYISFALDRAVWGVNPAGFHITNLFLHMSAALLFYMVTAALFKKERLAFVAALIFALHPIAGETVNFLAGGRNTLLSACFALLSLLFYVRNTRIPAVACFAAAVFSKEFALLLPLIFLMHDLRSQREKIRFSRYVPYMATAAVYLVLRSIAVQKANFLAGITFSDMITAPYLVVRYGVNMMVPVQLKVLYNVQADVAVGIACSVVLAAVSGVVFIFRRHEELLFSACWFFLFLLPVINIVPLHTTTMMADRYAYFSLMGFALGLAAVICRLNGRAVTVAVAALCTLYASVDFSRNGIWKNEVEFFTRMTQDAPERFCGFKNLGMAYYRKGEIAPAVQSLEASDVRPDITVKYLIGNAYIFWKENFPDKAEKSLARVMELEPLNPEPHLVMMLIHEQYGNAAAARSYRDKVEKMGHGIGEILADRTVELCRAGEAYMFRRQYVDAEIYFWQVLRINPAYIPALVDMGSLRAEQGKLAEAVHYFRKALDLEPSNASAHYNLAVVYRMQGRASEAEAEMARFRDVGEGRKQKAPAGGPWR